MNTEDLEMKIAYLRDLSNEIVAQSPDGPIIYSGKVSDLKFGEYENIQGIATFTKYILVDVQKEKRSGFFFPKIKVTTEHKKKIFWEIQTDKYASFIFHGEPTLDGNLSYRTDIRTQGKNRGILFSDKLIDTVFGPIDEEIMEIYKAAKRVDFS